MKKTLFLLAITQLLACGDDLQPEETRSSELSGIVIVEHFETRCLPPNDIPRPMQRLRGQKKSRRIVKASMDLYGNGVLYEVYGNFEDEICRYPTTCIPGFGIIPCTSIKNSQ